jgi:hypothetical protein
VQALTSVWHDGRHQAINRIDGPECDKDDRTGTGWVDFDDLPWLLLAEILIGELCERHGFLQGGPQFDGFV